MVTLGLILLSAPIAMKEGKTQLQGTCRTDILKKKLQQSVFVILSYILFDILGLIFPVILNFQLYKGQSMVLTRLRRLNQASG